MLEEVKHFTYLLGETIEYAQIIESDLTIIYSSLISNDYYDLVSNAKELSDTNLGFLLEKLETERFLKDEELNILHKFRIYRNHLVHESFIAFCYEKDEEKRRAAFQKEMRYLTIDNESFYKIMKTIEQIKIAQIQKVKEKTN